MSGGAIQGKAFTEQIRCVTTFFSNLKKVIYFKIFSNKHHFWQVATEDLFQNKAC